METLDTLKQCPGQYFRPTDLLGIQPGKTVLELTIELRAMAQQGQIKQRGNTYAYEE